jgi:hypothetical protein
LQAFASHRARPTVNTLHAHHPCPATPTNQAFTQDTAWSPQPHAPHARPGTAHCSPPTSPRRARASEPGGTQAQPAPRLPPNSPTQHNSRLAAGACTLSRLLPEYGDSRTATATAKIPIRNHWKALGLTPQRRGVVRGAEDAIILRVMDGGD